MQIILSIIVSVILILTLIAISVYMISKLIKYLKNVNWQMVFANFDIYKILGRLYFVNMLLIIGFIDFLFMKFNNYIFKFYNVFFIICFVILSILTIIAVFSFIKSILIAFKHKLWAKNILDFIERVIVMSGVPRCGKTSSSVFISVLIAKINWHKLKREYWKVLNLPFAKLTKELQENKNEIIKSYTYFMKNIDKNIPCLYSFCDIYKGKRKSYKLYKSMLIKKKTLPYLSIFVVDEISSLFANQNQQKETDKKEDYLAVADLGRFIGQYFNGYMIFTEQNFSNAYKNLRDITGLDLHYSKSQMWVCKPKFLMFIYSMFYMFFDWYLLELEFLKQNTKSYIIAEKNLIRSSKFWGKFINFLSKIISNVGYRKYTYELQKVKKEEYEIDQNSTTKVFYIPAPLNATYNDRYFRNKYDCINKPLEEKTKNVSFFPTPEEIKEQFNDN